MRRLLRTAPVALALLGVACAVDRSGAGDEASGATAGSGPAINPGTSGSGGTGGSSSSTIMSGGTAGVFGVAMGNAGGDSGSGNQDHEGGSSAAGGSTTVEPVDSGSAPIDVDVPKEASSPVEASSVPDCATHAGGKTFTPSGAVGAHCYWPHTAKSAWQSADDACIGEGGHLATLTSAAENTFVVKLIANLTNNDRIWLAGTDNKSVTDSSGGGPYVWTTGEPFTYAPWAMNNPDGNCEKTCNGSPCQCQHRVCVDQDGIFWDRYEGDPNYFVCESEP